MTVDLNCVESNQTTEECRIILPCIDSVIEHELDVDVVCSQKKKTPYQILSRFYTSLRLGGAARKRIGRITEESLTAGQKSGSLDRDRTVPDVRGSKVDIRRPSTKSRSVTTQSNKAAHHSKHKPWPPASP
jgi:hypothetical protein